MARTWLITDNFLNFIPIKDQKLEKFKHPPLNKMPSFWSAVLCLPMAHSLHLGMPFFQLFSFPIPLPAFVSLVIVAQSLNRVWLFVTPWTVARQAPRSMGLPRQEYWSGLPFPSPGDLPNPGIELVSPALSGRVFTAEPPGKPVNVSTKAQMMVADGLARVSSE